MKTKEGKLILLDFDGTITTKDSFVLFIKFATSPLLFFLTGWIIYVVFIFHKLKLYNAKRAKEIILTFYFKGKSKKELQIIASNFIQDLLTKKIIKQDFLNLIQKEKQNQSTIVVVSASLDIWIEPFCNIYQLDLIASKAEYNEKLMFTGKLESANCNGLEKAIRIKNQIDLSQYKIIEAHGNSAGDKPMMALATHTFWY